MAKLVTELTAASLPLAAGDLWRVEQNGLPRKITKTEMIAEIGGVADGTTTNAMLRWSGTAWVQEGDLRVSTAGLLTTISIMRAGAHALTSSTLVVDLDAATGIVVNVGTAVGGWARGFVPEKISDGLRLGGTGFLGSNENLTSWHVGFGTEWWAADARLTLTPTVFTVDSLVSLRLENTGDASLASTGHAFQVGLTSGTNIIMDGNEIMARDNGAAATLFINADGGAVTFGNVTEVTATFKGALVAQRASGSGLFIVKDSGGAGTAANPFIQFQDSAALRIGYVGVGSGSTNDVYLLSDAGDIRLVAGGGDIFLDDNTTLLAGQSFNMGGVFSNIRSGGGAADQMRFRDSTDTSDLVLHYNGSSFEFRSENNGAGNEYIEFGTGAAITLSYAGVASLRTSSRTAADIGMGAQVLDGDNAFRPVGMNISLPQTKNAAYTFLLADNGQTMRQTDSTTRVWTVPNDANIPVGAMYGLAITGSGGVSLTGATGVTVIHFDAATAGGNSKTAGVHVLSDPCAGSLQKITDTLWHLHADNAA